MDDLEPVATAAELADCEALRRAVLEALKWERPDAMVADLFRREALVRFLRARNSKIDKASKMLAEAIRWRMSFDVEKVVATHSQDKSPEAQALRQRWPMGTQGVDKRGVPVYYARYGTADLAALASDAGFDRFLAQALSDQRAIEAGLDAASRAAGKHLVQIICVADFKGMQWSRAAKAVPTFKRLSRVLDDYFPERLHVAFATRAPWIFTAIWKLVAPFLAADTKAKVRILGKADDHLKALQEFIDFDQIPDFLGGGLPTTISDGGVPDAAEEQLDEVAPAPTTDEVVEQFRADEQQLPTNIE